MVFIRRNQNVSQIGAGRTVDGFAIMPDKSFAVGIVSQTTADDIVISEAEYDADLQTISAAWTASIESELEPARQAFTSLRNDYLAWRNADINNWSTMTSAERADHLRAGVRLSLRANKWMFEYLQNLDIENAP